MTESDARAATAALAGDRAMDRLESLAALVIDENCRQNLIASSTVPVIWARHLWDSVQLLHWLPTGASSWLDIGTGGGFPGLVVACIVDFPVTLVEPRRRRAEFLTAAAAKLGLDRVTVEQHKVEQIATVADVISARAVASVENLLRAAIHCATPTTRWLLPRGKSIAGDVASDLRRSWKGSFHVEHSLSDRDGTLLVLDGIAPR